MNYFKIPRINFRKTNYSKYQYDTISKHFDRKFYIENHSAVKKLSRSNIFFDPVKHYMQHGVAAGYDPHPNFSTSFYIKFNPDVIEADQNPFFHYIVYGVAEGRISKIGESKSKIIGLSSTYKGDAEQKPIFDTNIYETIKSEFDEDYYKNSNPDILEHSRVNPGFDCIAHYLDLGFKEGRDPCENFSSQHYLDINSDVRAAGINPFYHFIAAGRQEGRSGKHRLERRYPPLPFAPRILFVGHSGHRAGAEIMLRDMIAWYANKTSYNIDILILDYGPLCQTYQKFGKIITLNGEANIEYFTRCEFSRQKYDYIYCNSVASSCFFKVYESFFERDKVPLIIHIHEMREAILEHENNLQQIKKFTNRFIAASERVKIDLEKFYNVNPELIDVFESFINISAKNISDISFHRKDARRELGVQEGDFLIVGSGTVYSRKGPDTFVKTLEILSRTITAAKVVGVWIGDGPDYHGLRHWIQENGSEKNIKFVGFKDNARELISSADLFFLSSREDPFPLVCLEAAQYAVPVVYFKGCTGIDAFVRDDAGLAVPNYDEKVAARTIQYLINNAPLRAEMGFVARSRVMKSNNQSVIMPKLFEHLRRWFNINPTLSVIVPNYNHENFVGERIQSILDQDYDDMEILILDDASTDSSLDVISYYKNFEKVVIYTNEVGSGSPFKQWKKGLKLSKGKIVWIAESDDSCSANFLEAVLPGFTRNGVNISYSKTVNTDEFGNKNDYFVNKYLNNVAEGKFTKNYYRSGFQEVEEAMAVACTIVNASGAVMRKSALKNSIAKSDGFKMCGDWIVYLSMLKTGSVYYTVDSKNYFRRHSSSVVSNTEGTDIYFEERKNIAKYIVNNFKISDRTINRMTISLEKEWKRFSHIEKLMSEEDLFDFCRGNFGKQALCRNKYSIGIYIHGLMFSKGGIENQGVALANHLYRSGHNVVVFCRHNDIKIPVYELDSGIHISSVFDEYNVELSSNAIRSDLVNFGIEIFVVMLSESLFDPIVSAAKGLRLKIVASEHNDPWIIEKKWWSRSGREKIFRQVDYVHLLLPEYKKSVPYLNENRVVVIPNGVEKNEPLPEKVELNRRIIAVGRLEEQKNFRTLIKAFKLVAEKYEGWELHIFGEGSEKSTLSNLILSSGLKDQVYLRGQSEDIRSQMLKSDFIVIPSLFEGYPVVALEAKMSGLPIVAYEKCNGMSTLVIEEIDGILCKADQHSDKDGIMLAEAIVRAIKLDDKLLQMRDDINKRSETYSIDKVMEQWDSFIYRIMRE